MDGVSDVVYGPAASLERLLFTHSRHETAWS